MVAAILIILGALVFLLYGALSVLRGPKGTPPQDAKFDDPKLRILPLISYALLGVGIIVAILS